MSLLDLPIGQEATIERLDLDDTDRAMLCAMGLSEGEVISVLRAAIFGGPLHVHVAGTGFAIAREVARSVHVRLEGV